MKHRTLDNERSHRADSTPIQAASPMATATPSPLATMEAGARWGRTLLAACRTFAEGRVLHRSGGAVLGFLCTALEFVLPASGTKATANGPRTTRRSQARPFAATAAALLFASLAPAEAQVQTVMSGTMTAATNARFGTTWIGFDYDTVSPGSLTKREFSSRDISFEIDQLVYGASGTNADVLALRITSIGNLARPIRENPGLTLTVDGRRFSLDDAANTFTSGESRTFTWSNSGITWSNGDTVSVSLVQETTTRLTTLGLSNNASLNETFDPDTLDYTATVANSVRRITLTPTPSETGATIEYLDRNDRRLTDASTSTLGFQVDLIPGDNLIKVKVTGRNRLTRTYTLTVTRAAGTALEPNPPLPAGATVIYTGTLDVVDVNNIGVAIGGTPSPRPTFSLGRYRGIETLYYHPDNNRFALRNKTNGTYESIDEYYDKNRLVLQVGGRQYRIADAMYVHPNHRWADGGLRWSGGERVAIRLVKLAPQAPRVEASAVRGAPGDIEVRWEPPLNPSLNSAGGAVVAEGYRLEVWRGPRSVHRERIDGVNSGSTTVHFLRPSTKPRWVPRIRAASGTGLRRRQARGVPAGRRVLQFVSPPGRRAGDLQREAVRRERARRIQAAGLTGLRSAEA